MHPDPYHAVEGADALVIVTEWLVYRNPDFDRLKSLLRRPVVVDGRNLFDPHRMRAMGFDHHGIGRRRP
jgi:UDPglucose 6-dehydrogenase